MLGEPNPGHFTLEVTMNEPTETQIEAGMAKARALLEAYSSFDSSMVSDDLLKSVVTEVATAILNTK
jgi:guanylate kinase